MDCRSCGTVNAPGRRYCRECGGRLGHPCPACGFLNGRADKHCGGCGRRLRPAPAERAPSGPPSADELSFGEVEEVPVAAAGAAAGGSGVSETEIDGLFENMLEEEEPGAGA